MRPAIAGREVAKDAVIDRVSLGADVDRLGDVEGRVSPDLDFADVAEDALVRLGGRRNCREEQGGEEPPDDPHAQAAGRANETFGADWMLGSSSW